MPLVYGFPSIEGHGWKVATYFDHVPFDPDTGERIVTAEEDPRRATCPHSCRRAWKMRSPAGAFTGAVTWIVPAPTVTFRGASSAVAHHQPPAVRPPLLVAQYTPR